MSEAQTPVLPAGAPTGERIAAGTVLGGKYRVDRVLAEGGMGYVVAATHLHLQERVALKLLLPEVVGNREAVERFVREAQAAARLKGEHVARVIDVGTLPTGAPYMVMEYLDGADLGALLTARRLLPPAEAADILLPVCEALAEAHARGIVHRDIKPGNVFLARRPDGSRLIKVLDFGISKALAAGSPALTRSLTAMGTPAYMSPEQLRSARDVDGRTDIWSLGVVLYECVTGRRPFEADSVPGLCLAVAEGTMQPLPAWVPARIADVIRRCLTRDPAGRWSTMGELAAALAPHAGDASAARTAVERARALERGVTTLEPGRVPLTRGQPTTLGGATMVIHGARHGRLTIAGLLAVGAVTTVWLALGRPGESGRHDPAPGVVVSATLEPDAAPPVELDRPHASAAINAGPAAIDANARATPAIDAAPAPAHVGSGTSRPTARGATTTTAPDKPSAGPAAAITVRVTSTPPGATVSRTADGVEVGHTPFETAMLRGPGQARFRLTLPGHLAATVTIDLDQPDPILNRDVTLTPAPPAVPTGADELRQPLPSSRGRGQPASPGDL